VGQIRNESEGLIEYVEAIATLYDTAGNVVGCSARFVESRHLEAGQTGDFRILPSLYSDLPIASYRLQSDGKRQ